MGSVIGIATLTAADGADVNVRNSPATLSAGLTPLPQTLNPLIVKGWSLDVAGKVAPAPEYSISVLGPAPKEGAPRPVLQKVMYRPPDNTFRPTLTDATPTLEVPRK